VATQPKIVLGAEDRTAAAFASVSRRTDKLGAELVAFKSVAVGALGVLAVPISVAGLVGVFTASRDAIDAIKDLAEVSGSTVENISALDRIARATGGTFDQVAGTMVKFNQVLKDADPDKGAGAVLKALNLDIDELKRLDPAEALRVTAVALQNFAEDGDKARAIQELFGKSVKETAPFLRDLAEAGKLQGTVSAEAAEEVDKFSKELAKFWANVDDAERALTVGLVTSLNEVIEHFKVGQKEGKAFWQIAGGLYAGGVRVGLENIGVLDRKAPGFQPTYSPDDQSVAELARLTRRPSLVVTETSKDPKKPKGGAAKDLYAEANRYLEALQKQLEATEKLTETEQALRDLQLGRLGKVTEEQRKQILATAQQLDLDRELTEATKEADELRAESARKAKEVEEDRVQRIKDLVDAGATQQLEQQRDVMLELTAAYEKGELGLVGSEEALRKYTEAAQAFLGTADDQIDKISELDKFTQRAAENIQDALGDTFADVMEGNFDNIGDAFTKMLNRMVAEALAADIAKRMFGGAGGGSGSGWIGSLIGLAAGALGTGATASVASSMSGNSMDNFLALNDNFSKVPSFDVGTDFVPKDMLAMVHKGEKIVPAAENRAGSQRPLSVTNNFSVQGKIDRSTENQIAVRAGRAIQEAMRRNG
jgi:hypothetical protein